MRGSNNQDLDAFAAEARKRGMTYGQLQQEETLRLIKSGEIDKRNRKKKRGKPDSDRGRA